ncbi:MAG: LLM class flavin-dependent oxidoreductase [Frankiaceae bacterium]
MRFGISLPPFGDFADPASVAALAEQAEAAGWDGFFVWDHLLRADGALPIGDPWTALAAVAVATRRMRIGPLVTPLARRRPWVVARQAVSLDQLSGGRTILGVGLGNDRGRELSAFGEATDPKERAALLDESLAVLSALWSGEPVTYDGAHLHVHEVRFLPRPVQRPGIPIWVGGEWPNRAPWRRAARYDGAFPVGAVTDAADVRALAEQVAAHRPPGAGPFDLVVQGRAGRLAAGAAADLGALAAAGATWWMEAFRPEEDPAQVRAAVAAGPRGAGG